MEKEWQMISGCTGLFFKGNSLVSPTILPRSLPCSHDFKSHHLVCVADEWKSDPDFALYLSQLSSLSMEKLREL